jgi:hypothetical protein
MEEPIGDLPEDLHQMIVNTSVEIFSGKEANLVKMLPSTNSTVQATRKDGGAFSKFEKFSLPSKDDPNKQILGSLVYLNQDYRVWRQKTFDEACIETRKEASLFKTFIDRHGVQQKAASMNAVSVIPLFEPSKIRTITKGNAYLYTALQPSQSEMLARWKRTRYSTMKDEDLTEKVQSLHAKAEKDWVWYSVDYKDATNLLKRQATFSAIHGLKDWKQYSLIESSFEPNHLFYPTLKTPACDEKPSNSRASNKSHNRSRRLIKKNINKHSNKSIKICGESIKDKDSPQPKSNIVLEAKEVFGTGGQLMGHVLSFPLLCTINLSVFRLALERYLSADPRRRREVRQLWHQVIINGDDMVFKGPVQLWPYLEKACESAGFKFSVGKNYMSLKSCMINSQLFHEVNGGMVRIGYINQKLITPAKASTALPTDITRDVSKMCHLQPAAVSLIPRAMNFWCGKWFNKQKFFKPNWYLPVHLGGLGLDPIFSPEDNKVTYAQRLVAARMLKEDISSLFSRKQDREAEKLRDIYARAKRNWFSLNTRSKFTKQGRRNLYGNEIYAFREIMMNDDEEDPWLNRFLLIYFSVSGMPPPDLWILKQFHHLRKDSKPLSSDEIVENFNRPGHHSCQGPECPPLNVLRLS